MTFSTGCLSPTTDRNQKHQSTVTHRALGLHIPGNPRSGPRLSTFLAGVAVSVRVESGASRTKWRRATNVCSAGRRKAGKGTEYALSQDSLPSQGASRRAGPYTVKAEKGSTRLDDAERGFTVGDKEDEAA